MQDIFKVQSHLVKSLFSLSFLNVLGSIFSYFTTIQLARSLKPESYGAYANVLVLASFLMILVVFGTEQTSSFLYKKGRSISSIASLTLKWKICVFIALFLYLLVDELIYDVDDFFLIAAAFGTISLSNIYELSNRNERFLVVMIVEKIFYFSSVTILNYFETLNLDSIFYLLFLTALSSLLFQIYDNWRYLKVGYIQVNDLKYLVKLNLPLVVLSISMFVYGGFSRVFIEYSLGSKNLGVYSAAWQFVTIASIFMSQVTRVWRLRLTDAIISLDLRRLLHSLSSFMILAILPCVIIGLVLFFLGEYLVLFIYGSEYIAAVPVFKYFAFYTVTIGFSLLTDILWVATGKTIAYMVLNVVMAICVLIVYIVMRDRMTLLDFAFTTVVSHSLATILSIGFWFNRFFKRFI